MSITTKLFDEYLELHQLMKVHLRSLLDEHSKINNNIILMSIFIIKTQIKDGGRVNITKVYNNPIVPASSSYRVVQRMINLKILEQDDKTVRFKKLPMNLILQHYQPDDVND